MAEPDINFTMQYGDGRNQRPDAAAADIERRMTLIGRRLGPLIRVEMEESLKDVYEKLEKRHSQKWAPDTVNPRGKARGQLNRKSGKMLRSIKSSIKVRGRGENIEGSIGGNALAALHETGGRIKPTNSDYLAIPLPAALTSAGKPKKRKPREWQNTFVFESRNGNLLIAQRRGRRIVPLYLLKKSVKIPVRLGLDYELGKMSPIFERRVVESILRETEKVL